jgi:hypothetical protein
MHDSDANSRTDPENPLLHTLSSRITFHSQVSWEKRQFFGSNHFFDCSPFVQLVAAYEALSAFEAIDDQGVVEKEKVSPRTAWAVEALSWITTAETVSRANLDLHVIKKRDVIAKFAAFASSLSSFDQIKISDRLSKRFKVSFSDSSRTRKEVLVRIFNPLLHDVFSSSITNSVFEHLGLADDIDYLQTVSACNLQSYAFKIPASLLTSSAAFITCSALGNGLSVFQLRRQ